MHDGLGQVLLEGGGHAGGALAVDEGADGVAALRGRLPRGVVVVGGGVLGEEHLKTRQILTINFNYQL